MKKRKEYYRNKYREKHGLSEPHAVTCLQCGQEFIQTRAEQKFCSNLCGVKYRRRKND